MFAKVLHIEDFGSLTLSQVSGYYNGLVQISEDESKAVGIPAKADRPTTPTPVDDMTKKVRAEAAAQMIRDRRAAGKKVQLGDLISMLGAKKV